MKSAATSALGRPTSLGLEKINMLMGKNAIPNITSIYIICEKKKRSLKEYKPEEKLTIQVGNINSVHVNDTDVPKA